MKFFKNKFLVVVARSNGEMNNMEIFADDEAGAKAEARAALIRYADQSATIVAVFPVAFV